MNEFAEVLSEKDIDLSALASNLAEELENSYYAFYQLLSSTPGSFMLISDKGKVLAASKRMREKFLKSNDITGKYYEELSYPFFVDCSRDKIINNLVKHALDNQLDLERVLIEGNDENHEYTLLELNLQLIKNSNGVTRSLMMNFVENIVRQNILPGNLEKDQKLKKLGSMSIGLVHEIKNPMQSISSILQLLQHKYSDDNYINGYLDSAMAEVHKVNNIMNELLTFSGVNEEHMVYTHINDVCNEVLNIIYGNCYMNEIELITNFSDDIPDMILDKGRIKQVIVNFVTNSVDAINSLRYTADFNKNYPDYNGKITLETEYNYDLNECYIIIKDNGIGMDEKTLKTISQPFFTTKKYGTGIGVYISKNIIKNHGGRLKIESQVGKGSTFTTILPELAGLMELKSAGKKNGLTIKSTSVYMPEDYDFE